MDTSNFSDFLPLKDVTITGGFWKTVFELVRTNVIPYQWEALNDRVPGAAPSYCMHNFKLAARITHPELDYGVDIPAGHKGPVFQDSDFPKWLEALSYTLFQHPDKELEKTADEAIDIVCNAQQADGYLNTYYIINGLDKRFTNMMNNHELYCLGHFIEGAAAYYQVTGKRKLLDAMLRYIDFVDSVIGPDENKLHGYPGCEVIEMALVKLYAITKDEKHLRLSKYFIDQRGQEPLFFREEMKKTGAGNYWDGGHLGLQYYQAGRPVRDQHSAEGHAVRGPYLYSGMADIARLTCDDGLYQACKDIWDNIVNKQMYINGAIGQSEYGESFTFAYDLPNDTIYAETCAAISLAFFAQRMARISPKGEYGDIIEKTIFNSILSGISLDGQRFFYVNPLETLPEASEKSRIYHHVKIERQKWLGCACCPPNVARTFASLGAYAFSICGDTLYSHLYMGMTAKASLGGSEVKAEMKTGYPWDGGIEITFTLENPLQFTYAPRLPSWRGTYSVKINGRDADFKVNDGFIHIQREWKNGDTVTINFDMPVTLIRANPKVRQDIGKVAVTRGPLVYCLEEKDNGKGLFRIYVDTKSKFTFSFEEDLLGGVIALKSKGKKLEDWKGNPLYKAEEPGESDSYKEIDLTWIPYYAWANRDPGEMAVWIHKMDS
ncbi:MAG: glycoside hydrolase family 127 protein [Treponema sp.]|jgi:DUF1680 family protein|nr:glycoside hydrolase family 127 protein [Treponema sp.]